MFDLGTTRHFLLPGALIINKQPTTNPLSITIQNGCTITSAQTCLPSKLVYEILHRKHNFNGQLQMQKWTTPVWKEIVHNYLISCTSWGSRGTNVWYTGPANYHNPCISMHIMVTKKYQIYKGVTFQSKFCSIPKVQSWDYTIQVPEELLIEIIKLNKKKVREPSKNLHVLEQLIKIFQDTTNEAISSVNTLTAPAIPIDSPFPTLKCTAKTAPQTHQQQTPTSLQLQRQQ